MVSDLQQRLPCMCLFLQRMHSTSDKPNHSQQMFERLQLFAHLDSDSALQLHVSYTSMENLQLHGLLMKLAEVLHTSLLSSPNA